MPGTTRTVATDVNTGLSLNAPGSGTRRSGQTPDQINKRSRQTDLGKRFPQLAPDPFTLGDTGGGAPSSDPFARPTSPYAVGFDQDAADTARFAAEQRAAAQAARDQGTGLGLDAPGGTGFGSQSGIVPPAASGPEGNTDPSQGLFPEPEIDPTTGQPVGFSVNPQVENFVASLSPDAVDLNAMRSWMAQLQQTADIGAIYEDPNNPGTYIAEDLDGNIIGTNGALAIDPLDKVVSDIQVQQANLSAQRLALDTETQREQLRIQEELGRIDQDIARDRIRADQETALGNWQNALDIQRSIDERERAGRQLERDLFNAGQELQNRRFELDRAGFDLEKLEFFQSLSRSPANFADLFNLSRGLAPTGAGGPLPQGIQRVAGQSQVQQTAAQDFRMNGINLGVNANSGALPQLGAEGALGAQQQTAPSLSFLGGNDPTPVGPDGQPISPAGQVPPASGTPALDETGAGGQGGAPFPGFQDPAGSTGVLASPAKGAGSQAPLGAGPAVAPGAGYGNIGGGGEEGGGVGPQAQIYRPRPGDGIWETLSDEQRVQQGLPTAAQAAQQPQIPAGREGGTNLGNLNLRPPNQLADNSGGLPVGAAQPVNEDPQQIVQAAQQGAPLPPGLQIAFNGDQPGAPQTLPNSIPILSPQTLAQLTPAEQEAYFALAQMQGQYLPDFQNLVASRGAPQQQAGNRRVFA